VLPLGSHLSVPKTNADGPMNMAFSPKKEEVMRAPMN